MNRIIHIVGRHQTSGCEMWLYGLERKIIQTEAAHHDHNTIILSSFSALVIIPTVLSFSLSLYEWIHMVTVAVLSQRVMNQMQKGNNVCLDFFVFSFANGLYFSSPATSSLVFLLQRIWFVCSVTKLNLSSNKFQSAVYKKKIYTYSIKTNMGTSSMKRNWGNRQIERERERQSRLPSALVLSRSFRGVRQSSKNLPGVFHLSSCPAVFPRPCLSLAYNLTTPFLSMYPNTVSVSVITPAIPGSFLGSAAPQKEMPVIQSETLDW